MRSKNEVILVGHLYSKPAVLDNETCRVTLVTDEIGKDGTVYSSYVFVLAKDEHFKAMSEMSQGDCIAITGYLQTTKTKIGFITEVVVRTLMECKRKEVVA